MVSKLRKNIDVLFNIHLGVSLEQIKVDAIKYGEILQWLAHLCYYKIIYT